MEMHRIAAARGFFHPNMMLGSGHRKPTAQELTETLAYERLQPTGMRRLDVALACLRYKLFQYASGGQAGRSPEDFMVFHEEEPMSANEIKSSIKAAMAKHRAKKKQKKQGKIMATVISKMAIDVIARAGGLASGLGKAETRLGRFVGTAKKLGSGLATAFAFIGPGIALHKFVATVRSGFAELDKLAKDSVRLGVAPELLQQFDHAASITGVSAEVLRKAVLKMQKSISDAGVGLSTPARALEQLGLEANQLKNLGLQQQFGLIADKLKGVTSEADRTRIVMDLLGRGGAELKRCWHRAAKDWTHYSKSVKI